MHLYLPHLRLEFQLRFSQGLNSPHLYLLLGWAQPRTSWLLHSNLFRGWKGPNTGPLLHSHLFPEWGQQKSSLACDSSYGDGCMPCEAAPVVDRRLHANHHHSHTTWTALSTSEFSAVPFQLPQCLHLQSLQPLLFCLHSRLKSLHMNPPVSHQSLQHLRLSSSSSVTVRSWSNRVLQASCAFRSTRSSTGSHSARASCLYRMGTVMVRG